MPPQHVAAASTTPLRNCHQPGDFSAPHLVCIADGPPAADASSSGREQRALRVPYLGDCTRICARRGLTACLDQDPRVADRPVHPAWLLGGAEGGYGHGRVELRDNRVDLRGVGYRLAQHAGRRPRTVSPIRYTGRSGWRRSNPCRSAVSDTCWPGRRPRRSATGCAERVNALAGVRRYWTLDLNGSRSLPCSSRTISPGTIVCQTQR